MGMSFCHFNQDPTPPYVIAKEGWLYKKSSSVFTSHSRLWVVVSSSPYALLLCFKSSKKRPKECTMHLSFKDLELVLLSEMGFQFQPKKGIANSLIFYCNDEIEYQKWVKAFIGVIDSPRPSMPSSSRWTMRFSDDEDNKEEGIII